MDYEKQATDFLQKTNTSFEAKFLRNDFYFTGDKEKRDIYEITLARGERKIVFTFGQSLADSSKLVPFSNYDLRIYESQLNSLREKLCNGALTRQTLKGFQRSYFVNFPKTPTPYCVLAGLQKYDCGSFENFCDDFGYDTDSITAKTTYEAVVQEFSNVQKIWTDQEIEELQEIN